MFKEATPVEPVIETDFPNFVNSFFIILKRKLLPVPPWPNIGKLGCCYPAVNEKFKVEHR
jgi:hypothetical protein